MNLNDLLIRLIIEVERDLYMDDVNKICLELSEFARISNFREMNSTYQKLRERTKKHRNLIKELRNEANK